MFTLISLKRARTILQHDTITTKNSKLTSLHETTLAKKENHKPKKQCSSSANKNRTQKESLKTQTTNNESSYLTN